MSKIAIFGTGIDGRRLHRILRKRININYFLDLNPKLNKKIFFKIPVYSPNKSRDILKKTEIVYLGGRYMDDQEKYLKSASFKGQIIKTSRWDYSYTKKEIEVREKILCKILKKVLTIFEKHKIEYLIDGSSLLAINRNQKLSEFTDVDIAIKNDNKKIRRMLESIKSKKINLNKEFFFHEKKNRLFKKGSFKQCVLTSNCNSYKREPVSIEFYSETKSGNYYYRIVSSKVVSKISKKFRKYIKYKFYNNLKLCVPKNSHEYLEFIYGKKWRIKNKNWKNQDNKKRFKDIRKII